MVASTCDQAFGRLGPNGVNQAVPAREAIDLYFNSASMKAKAASSDCMALVRSAG